MRRVLLILAIAVLLLPAPHSAKDLPVTPGSLLVRADPLPLNAGDPLQRQVGPLTYLGGWHLTSPSKEFGGISSMLVSRDGDIIGLSDSGTLFGFHLGPEGGSRQFIAPLPVRDSERSWPNWRWDSESMVHDPVSGRYWVGFELIQRVCRYSPAFARLESCYSPPEIAAWPLTGGAEAMTRLPDGRFLVFSEMGYGPGGGTDLLLFPGDPSEASTPHPIHMGYRAPAGFKATDAVYLGHGRLLVLNRRVTLYDGFTAALALVQLPPAMKPDMVLEGREIARFAPPLLADNFEALALSEENGRKVLWIASDDNHEFFQRTLLMKFALPDSLTR